MNVRTARALQTKILEKMTDCEDLKEFFSEDLMVKNPVTVYRDSSVGEVRSLMLKRGISHTPVIDREGRLRGVITAKDIVLNFFKPRERITVGERRGEKPRIFKMNIKGIVDAHPLHVTSRTPIVDVVREMASLKKGYCLVVDKHRLVGIITPRDVIKLLIDFKPSIHIPLYVFGLENEDEAEMELAKRKIERVAMRGLKMHPALQEIVVHGKTSRLTGNRKRYKIRARAYTPTTKLAFAVEGWSLPNVFDELAQKIDKRLKQTKTKTQISQKKPSRQISPMFNSN